MPKIAPSAAVDPKASLADDIEVGPGCFVGPDVHLGPGCRLMPNVTVMGCTRVGKANLFFPGTVIGAPPQDLKYQGEKTQLIIGDGNVFRECVTAHTGTEIAGGVTEIGHHNQFQVGTHIAHDAKIGSHCIVSNQVQIAGHVHIEDHVTISGLVGVQQFVTIGRFSFIAGMARCTSDTPPYMIFGFDGTVQGVNVKGLYRWGFDEASVQELRDLFKRLYPRKSQGANHYRLRSLYTLLTHQRNDANGAMSLAKRIREIESAGSLNEHCQYLVDFLKRSIYDGVYGRHLESQRRDSSVGRAKFYNRDNGGNGR